jgi:HTH-type transcriptional regulator / antitoxin HigA
MSRSEHDPLQIRQEPVGKFLCDELGARGWSQADFAAVLDRPLQFVSEIVTGKKEITRESAAQIGAAFSQPPEYWLKLQDQYFLAELAKSKNTRRKLEEVRRRALLTSKAPIQLLQRNGLLKSTNLDDLEAEVMSLLELGSLETEPAFAAAVKRGNHGQDISISQRCWVAYVRKAARTELPRKEYSREGLQDLACRLPRMLKASDDFIGLPDILADIGVRLAYAESFPSGNIDGCAMYIDGHPVIGISGRQERLDKVLFTLLHEISHVILEHVNTESIIVDRIDAHNDSESLRESEADKMAADFLFPDGFPRPPARISGSRITQIAAELGLARIVIVGHLQRQKLLARRTILAKNAPGVGDALRAWK